MIAMTPAYFNKTGDITKDGAIYKYIFASTNPHFYFTAYVVPGVDTFDLFGIPTTNNFSDNSSVKLGDNDNFSIEGVPYGTPIEILLGNDDIEGYSDYINVSVLISEMPVVVNGILPDMPYADFLEEKILPLKDIRLYKLSDIIRVEVASLMSSMEDHSTVDRERAVEAFIFTLLVNRDIFIAELPSGLDNDFCYELFGKILYGGAYSDNIAVVFSDMIMFFRTAIERNIDVKSMPVKILATLMSRWAKTKSEEYLLKMIQASALVPVTMEISLNPVTVSDETRLFQVLNEIQSFVYITGVQVKKDGALVASASFNNEYFENLYRSKDECLVARQIKNGGKSFQITYGYGSIDCDNFIGMNYIDRENLLYYGLNKEDVLINDRVENAVVYEALDVKIDMLNGNLDSSLGLTFIINGV